MRFPFSIDLIMRLPRHPDWKYELIDGEAWLSPRPKPIGFVRRTDLPVVREKDPTHGAEVRALALPEDGEALTTLLTDVWTHEDPYRSFEPEDRAAELDHEIARSLTSSQTMGGAVAAEDGGRLCGCVIVSSTNWSEHPTIDWLTVCSSVRGSGLATALLEAVVGQLTQAGHAMLASYASGANLPSLRWHLARGFEATPDPLYEILVEQERRLGPSG